MSMSHYFYFAKKDGDKYVKWEHAPIDEEGRQNEVFWLGRSSDNGEKVDRWFNRINKKDISDDLLVSMGFELNDTSGWGWCDFDVIELDKLTPKQTDFVRKGYFLSDEVNAYLSDEYFDVDDLMMSKIEPEVFAAKLQAETQMSKGVAEEKRDFGEKLALDYMYFVFADIWGLEYHLDFAKQVAEMYQDKDVCLIHFFS